MRIIIYLILVLGVIARIFGVFNDFWLDEIWALELVKDISSWQEIFTEIHRDNNHIINSLWNYLAGQNAAAFIYRFPAFLFSIATLIVIYKISPDNIQQSSKLSFIPVILFSLSYVMVLYGTEARGYAGLVFFSLANFYIAGLLLKSHSPKIVVAFWLTAVCGLFSHLSWIGFYSALILWMGCEAFKSFGFKQSLEKMTLWHLPILASVTFEYLIDAKYIPAGTGDMRARLDVIVDTLSIFAGGPLASPSNLTVSISALIFAAIVLYLLLSEIYQLWTRGDRKFYFYFILTVAIPVAVIASAPRVLFERYFLVSITFAYLLLAQALQRIAGHNISGKILASILLLVFLSGNLFYLVSFVRHGRGKYEDLLSYMQQHDSHAVVSISGDHDFRNEKLINYYSRKLTATKPFRYSSASDLKSECPEWYLQQTQDLHKISAKLFQHSCGSEFELEREESFTALSGWRWLLYRNNNFELSSSSASN